MSQDNKTVRFNVVRYTLKGKTVSQATKTLTIPQIQSGIVSGLSKQAVGRANLAGLCHTMVTEGLPMLGFSSLRKWGDIVGVSHQTVANYATIGRSPELTERMAHGAPMTLCLLLVRAVNNPDCTLTIDQALTLSHSTIAAAKTAVASATTSSDSDDGDDNNAVADTLSEYAAGFSKLTLAELQSVLVLLQAEIATR